jgi:hypothetical protein
VLRHIFDSALAALLGNSAPAAAAAASAAAGSQAAPTALVRMPLTHLPQLVSREARASLMSAAITAANDVSDADRRAMLAEITSMNMIQHVASDRVAREHATEQAVMPVGIAVPGAPVVESAPKSAGAAEPR